MCKKTNIIFQLIEYNYALSHRSRIIIWSEKDQVKQTFLSLEQSGWVFFPIVLKFALQCKKGNTI